MEGSLQVVLVGNTTVEGCQESDNSLMAETWTHNSEGSSPC